MAKRGEWLETPYPVVREEIPVAFLSNSFGYYEIIVIF